MKKSMLYAVCAMVLTCTHLAVAQAPDTLWTKTYGEAPSHDLCFMVSQTPDGGFLLSGRTGTAPAWPWYRDAMVVRTDLNGNSLQIETYDPNIEGGFAAGYEDGSGNRYFTGNQWDGSTGDGWVVKTNSSGDVTWNLIIGSNHEDRLHDALIDSDGNFVAAGFTGARGVGYADFWLTKIDPLGTTLFDRSYYNVGWGMSVAECPDGYLIAGETNIYGAGGFDGWVVKTNSGGDSLWSGSYGGPGNEGFARAISTYDGGFVLVGSTNSFGAGSNDFWLVRIAANGDSLWSKTYGGNASDVCNSVRQLPDGGFILAGSTESFGAGSTDLWLLRTNGNGDSLWSKTIGGPGFDTGNSLLVEQDGAIVVGGYTSSFGAGNEDFWLIKLAPDQFLPVELLSFNAVAVRDAIQLSFSTASETDNDYFEIWRCESAEGSFSRIGVLPSQGNTSNGHSYEYTDHEVHAGQNYWYFLAEVDLSGIRTEHRNWMVSASVGNNLLPGEYSLTAYPNPFNPITQIRFDLPERANVQLLIYNSLGQRVASLLNEVRNAGTHHVEWNGKDDFAVELAGGVYICQIRAGSFVESMKMMLMR